MRGRGIWGGLERGGSSGEGDGQGGGVDLVFLGEVALVDGRALGVLRLLLGEVTHGLGSVKNPERVNTDFLEGKVGVREGRAREVGS
jgi:hypothetical protein